MLLVPEAIVPQLVSAADVIACVEQTFIADDGAEATPFPVVRETLGYRQAVFGVKSSLDRSAGVLCLKGGRLLAGKRGARADQSPVHRAAVRRRDWQAIGPGRWQLPDRCSHRRGSLCVSG